MWLILFLGALFFAVGLLVTKKNAAHLLTTYSHLPYKERSAIDASRDAIAFRRFHFFLGSSLILFGLAIYYLLDPTAGLLFAVFYPLAGYLWFFAMHIRRGPKGQSFGPTVGIIAIAVSIIGVLLLMRWGFSPNDILLTAERIEITGPYGEVIRSVDIASVAVVDSLPDIKLKKNGFAIGRIAKGYFLLKNGQTVKLIVDGAGGPYLRIRRITGEELYVRSPSRTAAGLAADIRSTMPDVPNGN